MPEKKITLLGVMKELGLGKNTVVDFLNEKGFKIKGKLVEKLDEEMYDLLIDEFQSEKKARQEAQSIEIGKFRSIVKEEEEKSAEPKEEKISKKEKPKITERARAEKTEPGPKEKKETEKVETIKLGVEKLKGISAVGKMSLDKVGKDKPTKKSAEKEPADTKKLSKPTPPDIEKEKKEKAVDVVADIKEKKEETENGVNQEEEKNIEVKDETIRAKSEKLRGLKAVGKMELPVLKSPKKKTVDQSDEHVGHHKGKRKRIHKERIVDVEQEKKVIENKILREKKFKKKKKEEEKKSIISEVEIQEQIKKTQAKLHESKASKFADRARFRKQKRDEKAQAHEDEVIEKEKKSKVLKVAEFLTADELANMMDIPTNEVISTCMSLGMMVSINQRLDAELINVVADEFGFQVEFAGIDESETETEEEIQDDDEDLVERPPVITVMGHVDHGKTSLLDYVRQTNVVSGEVGGITQHIGAYEVQLKNDRLITFLDTPGHEAFTAMRARGAKLTDIAIIVVAADDAIMPQTKEAISHAQASNVPIVFAITKIDKPGANADKIREQLSGMNILVEDWGGKFQCQEISSISGQGVDDLLDKVLLESDILELKANPKRQAQGTVIEAFMDKGRGIVTKMLVQNGTLKIGDIVLAGPYYGKVKALYNERMKKVPSAGLSSPVMVLGINGIPSSGDVFKVMSNESKAKELASKRLQLIREQGERTQKHITLDEIGRRLSIGNFKELNLLIRGDVDGSVEALSGSFLKLSNEEIQINVLSKGVGQITDSDVLLASASDAIIIGFQVRPSISAKKLAEKEGVEIRTYSIIYDAINELEDAMKGMLAPKFEEKVTATVEIRETFKISKIGTIAGCMVLDGKINRNNEIRLIREGVVIYTGKLASLKRFKDDVKEVSSGYECGLNIEGYNDIKVKDMIESFEQVKL